MRVKNILRITWKVKDSERILEFIRLSKFGQISYFDINPGHIEEIITII